MRLIRHDLRHYRNRNSRTEEDLVAVLIPPVRSHERNHGDGQKQQHEWCNGPEWIHTPSVNLRGWHKWIVKKRHPVCRDSFWGEANESHETLHQRSPSRTSCGSRGGPDVDLGSAFSRCGTFARNPAVLRTLGRRGFGGTDDSASSYRTPARQRHHHDQRPGVWAVLGRA